MEKYIYKPEDYNSIVELVQWTGQTYQDAHNFLVANNLPLWSVGYHEGQYGILIHQDGDILVLRTNDWLGKKEDNSLVVVTPQQKQTSYVPLKEEDESQIPEANRRYHIFDFNVDNDLRHS